MVEDIKEKSVVYNNYNSALLPFWIIFLCELLMSEITKYWNY